MIKIFSLLKSPFFYLIFIILLGFYVRLYKIDIPIAEWHSWRQADTAAVARNFYKEGYNPLLPRYDNMSGVAENPVINPERFRFVEFPIYNSLVYFAYLINGGVDERLARLINIFFSLGSLIFVFLITRKIFGNITGLVAAFLFATLPFNVFYSRVILPEPSLVFFSLGMFYFTDLWIRKDSRRLYFTSIFFTASAFLTKPMASFYLLPLILTFYQVEKRFWPIPARYFMWAFFSFTPFIAWRVWIARHPEGIPASQWLYNGNGIRFRPAFWRWIVGDRLGREILSAPGVVLFVLGLIVRPKVNENYLLHLLALASFLYLIVFATGNVQHDYYQVLIVPALVIFAARGITSLISGVSSLIPRLWTIPLSIFLLGLTLYLGWTEIKGLYQINNFVIVEAGKKADEILPKEAKVIAPYGGDSAFLYQINRPGFPMVALPVNELARDYGITHYVSVNYDDKTNWLMKKYEVIEANPKFVILDLRKERQDFYENIKSVDDLYEPP